MMLIVLTTELALEINALTLASLIVHVVPMHNVKLPLIDQYVAVPVVGQETLTQNVTNVGF